MKAYTDIEQSKKLAEILPIGSADFHFSANQSPQGYLEKPIWGNSEDAYYSAFPCWSLAALLDFLAQQDLFPGITYTDTCYLMDFYFYKDEDEDGETIHPIHFIRTEGNTLVDTCVEMIYKLKERNLL